MAQSILIIEDETLLARNMCLYLRRLGYRVAVAGTGEEGLTQVDTFCPDLVLLDYRLPQMNGLEFLAHLEERERSIPVIMISGQHDQGVACKARQARLYGYRAKPFPLSELGRLVGQALRPKDCNELPSGCEDSRSDPLAA
jgi:DNA-binding NtrC family response regulator